MAQNINPSKLSSSDSKEVKKDSKKTDKSSSVSSQTTSIQESFTHPITEEQIVLPDLDRITSTEQISVPKFAINQVIGQEKAVSVIKKAAAQKRNVLLVGIPGTGKSLLALAMAQLLPASELEDILIYNNPSDENVPKVKVVKSGEGKKRLEAERAKLAIPSSNSNLLIIVFLFLSTFFLLYIGRKEFGDVITAALLIGLFIVGVVVMFASQMSRRSLFAGASSDTFKVLIDNSTRKFAPFIDATGARAGALLGDVRHDPLQSGGLGTPAHLRVEPGAIHRANKGVLFIDEVAALSARSQQELLTAMQEKKFSISGQSEMSSGALVHTEPVPCDFILVASGNYPDVSKMHPALRSRIRGYGYEVFMEESIADTPNNRAKIAQFVAQEIAKDGKIPHFSIGAVKEIISEASKRAGRKNKLTIKLRELGGLVRASGDIAVGRGAKLVEASDVLEAKRIAKTLEQQAAGQIIEMRKEYKIFLTSGFNVGKVNGLAVMGESGIVLPIVAEVAPSSSREEGRIIATGKLGSIAKEAVENVSAIVKLHTGKDMRQFDIHVQFLQTYEGVEGDSASISVAAAVISALEKVAIDQSIAMTGSLSVRGEVLPVGGVGQKIEAAVEAGMKKVIVPKSNYEDLALDDSIRSKIEIIPVSNISEVLTHALKKGNGSDKLISKIKKEFSG